MPNATNQKNFHSARHYRFNRPLWWYSLALGLPRSTFVKQQHLKLALPAMLLIASMAACSAGNSTPAVPGPSSAAFGSSASLGRAVSPRQPETGWVALRSAASFVILAGTTVTNTGPSRITGNVGIFPGSAITGFPPGAIDGTLHAGDGVAQQAELDLTRAYNAAMSRARNPIAVAGNLGGQTLAPGLYKSTSSLAVSSGDLTLDGGGDYHSVFVFQMASTFNMTSGRKVILTNGARARNVFWAVGSSASLGTGCSFFGNLLAHQSISLATGTVMLGRALARVGAVTMQRNTLVKPAP
jgi:hypothetical protein